MRTTKLGAVLASLAITVGATAVLSAAPANAATATTTKLDISGHKNAKGAYGDYVGSLSGSVTDSNGDVFDGTVELQAKQPGKAWKTVRTSTDPGFFSFGSYGSKARGNVEYRAHYLGNATDAASYSGVVKVTTYWNLHESGSCSGGCHFHGKLGPKAKHHKVTIQVKHGHWKKYKVVKTNTKSKWNAKVTATRGKGTLYRAVVGGTKKIHKTTSAVWRFYKF
jgi:hypothetical protein